MELDRGENQLFRGRLVQVVIASVLIPVVLAQFAPSIRKHNDAIESLENLAINRLLIISVTSDTGSDAFRRLNRSISSYNIDLVVLDSQKASRLDKRSGTKLNEIDLVRGALSSYRKEQDLVIMLIRDRLILNANQRDIVRKFQTKFKPTTRIALASDSICWPENECPTARYPVGTKAFVNSNALIGLSSSLWHLFNMNQTETIVGPNSIQSLCSQAYLDDDKRSNFGLELDERSELFQSIRDHDDENLIELDIGDDSVRIKNSLTKSEPLVLLGSTRSTDIKLNTLGNYLAKSWTKSGGCNYCNETSIDIDSLDELPTILMAIFVHEATPFLDDFFRRIVELEYPKNRIHLLVYNALDYHKLQVDKFIDNFGGQYSSHRVFPMQKLPLSEVDGFEAEWQARNYALDYCRQLSCDYYLSLDSVARLEHQQSLRILIEANQTIVAPLLNRPRKLWSNFWGSMTSDGFYARSFDYVDLVKRERKGLWNVPHIMNAYLINGKFIRRNLDYFGVDSSLKNRADNFAGGLNKIISYYELATSDLQRSPKPALAFSKQLRSMNVFQYILNTHEFGYLVDPTNYNLNRTRPDFYQLEENPLDWEREYLHENYTDLFDENELENLDKIKEYELVKANELIEEPCRDVYWFPLVSPKFSSDLIAIMEAFGRWSTGNNDDPRIEGGYESVPTRDIHLKQVGLHEMWLTFLKDYVQPIQLKQYIGYEHDPPRADLAFVVRYHPEEQPSLRPHHDSSTYTLNIALNSPNSDYEGGGCRFVRYNCSVTQTRPGWALIHPGRLTHYHEGLPVTKGTRYILVTFVDP